MSGFILTKSIDGVHVITLNRPEKLNCINLKMLEELEQSIQSAEIDRDVRVVIFRGAGERAFSTGGDLKAFKSQNAHETAYWIKRGQEVFNKIESLAKPTIAVIQGYAFGGGLELALACDFRIATPNATFQLPEVLLGWPPGWGALVRIGRLVGEARAKEIVLLAPKLSAQKAFESGLVTKLVDDGELESVLQDTANILLKIDSDIYSLAKAALNKSSIPHLYDLSFDSLAAQYSKFIKTDKYEG